MELLNGIIFPDPQLFIIKETTSIWKKIDLLQEEIHLNMRHIFLRVIHKYTYKTKLIYEANLKVWFTANNYEKKNRNLNSNISLWSLVSRFRLKIYHYKFLNSIFSRYSKSVLQLMWKTFARKIIQDTFITNPYRFVIKLIQIQGYLWKLNCFVENPEVTFYE